jgi:hypothetical protein
MHPAEAAAALALPVSVIVMSPVSMEPKLELTVSQDRVLIEYMTVPIDSLKRYSMERR